MDEFKEITDDIIRPLVMIFTFVYLALVCHPSFLFAEDLLWVFIVDDWVFGGWWFIMLLFFGTVILALWMLIMVKMGLWK